MPTYPEIKALVERKGGIYQISMRRLREASSHGKLGVKVVRTISYHLQHYGMDHRPVDLPLDQNKCVTIFLRNSLPERIIKAVENPSKRSCDLLRSLQGPSE